jgi:hypothetical protein
MRADGPFNIDASLAKRFPIGEPNRPNKNFDVADLSAFDRITNTLNTPREFQFSAWPTH